jgi:hypothetical protein
VLISSQDFASSVGSNALICSLDGVNNLLCQWGTAGSADFWTCAHRLYLVQPGYDFTYSCRDAITSYKVDVYAETV